VNTKIRKQIERRKQRIARRLDRDKILGCDRPAMTASNIAWSSECLEMNPTQAFSLPRPARLAIY
jgi:hypothetical protein